MPYDDSWARTGAHHWASDKDQSQCIHSVVLNVMYFETLQGCLNDTIY